MNDKIKLDSIEDANQDFKDGKFVIVVDDEDRENEGDLIIAAEKITPEKVNFMLFQYLSQMMLWIKYDGLYIIRYARVATTYFIITLYISYDL